MPAGHTSRMVMSKELVIVLDGANDIAFIDLHVINVVEQFEIF
jgi:hypothetical protein